MNNEVDMKKLILFACLALPTGPIAAATMERGTLPKGLKWETNDSDPIFASPNAKKGGLYRDSVLSFPLTLRTVGPDSNGAFRSYLLDNQMDLTHLHPNTGNILPGLATHWAYGKDRKTPATRYSPPICTGCRPKAVIGYPDPAHVSTSYIERQNLTVRMQVRRFTRLTNAHSKKLRNLECALALHYMHYNFARVHATIQTTPAVKAGVAGHIWSIEEIVGLLERAEKSN